MSGQAKDQTMKERLWAAGEAAAASVAGPAGLAVGSTLLCAAAYAVGTHMSPAAGGGMPLTNAQAFPVMFAGLTSAMALIGAAPAAVGGFIQSLRGAVGPEAPGIKDALKDAWASARHQMIFGGAGVGLLASASLVASASIGAEGALSAAGFFASVPLALAGVAATVVAHGESVMDTINNSAAAAGDAYGIGQRQARVERQAAGEPGPSLGERIGAKLGSWRLAKSAALGEPEATAAQKPGV